MKPQVFVFFSFPWIFTIPTLYVLCKFIEVKVVVVFDAMMSGLPTHKENFAGYDTGNATSLCFVVFQSLLVY